MYLTATENRPSTLEKRENVYLPESTKLHVRIQGSKSTQWEQSARHSNSAAASQRWPSTCTNGVAFKASTGGDREDSLRINVSSSDATEVPVVLAIMHCRHILHRRSRNTASLSAAYGIACSARAGIVGIIAAAPIRAPSCRGLPFKATQCTVRHVTLWHAAAHHGIIVGHTAKVWYCSSLVFTLVP